ncbi:hypothetical protein [Herbidospora mongoliensis]|uniref:hypothetical protein n=1 Tax=Herbidospora mongoliensis TaxID=688067 RepID=UPI0012FA990A|nr:hypothetical protein [Herbidospora mongoliensis]
MRRQKSRLFSATIGAGIGATGIALIYFLIGGQVVIQAGAVTASPSPSTVVTGLDSQSVELNIDISPSRLQNNEEVTLPQIINSIDQRFRDLGVQDRQVGFVLIFASGPDPGRAQRTANQLLIALRKNDPSFSISTGEGYWKGSGDNFEMKIYFIAN